LSYVRGRRKRTGNQAFDRVLLAICNFRLQNEDRKFSREQTRKNTKKFIDLFREMRVFVRG